MAAALVLAVLAAALLLWQQPWRADPERDDAPAPVPADASTRLTAQLRDLTEADTRAEFVAAAGDLPAGRAFGRRTWSALQSVASGASLRYISGGDVPDHADGSATAVVEAEWRPAAGSGLDPEVTHRSTVELRVAPERDGTFSIVGASRLSGAVPLWLVGPVSVHQDDGRFVVRVDGGDEVLAVDELTSNARAVVERTLPGVSGDLTFVSPRTQAQMAAIVGQDTAAVAQIAAVTTSLDAESTADGVVVVLNPAVFPTMDERAAQIVLTHEAAHALTGAGGTSAENWIVEGFADWVALRSDAAPLSLSAGQILAEVKAGRTPDQLPSDADFGSTRHGLGALYESSWMIFRLLGERYGDAAVVSFYESALRGASTAEALRSAFGIDREQLTAAWRAYLTKSASTVS